MLEELIRLQLKYKKQDVTPLVIDYLNNLNNFQLNTKYSYEDVKKIAIIKLNSNLMQEIGYKT